MNKDTIYTELYNKYVSNTNNISIPHSIKTFHRTKKGKVYKDIIFENTKNIKYISDRLSQRLYHFLYKIDKVPFHANGIPKNFINFKEGYREDVEPPFYKITNIEKVFGETLLKHIFQNTLLSSSKICQKYIKKYTSFLPENIDNRLRRYYFKNDIRSVLHCKICNTIIYSDKYLPFCSSLCKGLDGVNIEKINELYLSKVANDKKKATRLLKKNDFLLHYIEKRAVAICPSLSNIVKEPYQLWYHYYYNIPEVPTCDRCKVSLLKKFSSNGLYPMTCSSECNNKCRKNIEKRLKNNMANKKGYYTNVGKYESVILNTIEKLHNITIKRQECILGYFIDGLYEKTIYSINEAYHLGDEKRIEKDKLKYKQLLEDGYDIIIVWIDCNKKKQIEKFKEIYSGVRITSHIFFDTSTILDDKMKILSSNGFEKVSGLRKISNKKEIVHIITEAGKEICCTSDHILYSDNIEREANSLYNGETISTLDGIEKITSIEKSKKEDFVFDIIGIDTKNSSYYTNEIQSHNCDVLVIDEMAFIAPNIWEDFSSAVMPIVSSSKSSQIIIVSTPNGINHFHQIWESAELRTSPEGWVALRIDWWEKPGRDEQWKQQQLETFNHDKVRFSQEYGNCGKFDTKLILQDEEGNIYHKTMEDLYNEL